MNDQTQQQTETKPGTALQVFRLGLVQMQEQFKAALPAHIPVERFTRVANTAVANNPDLLRCTERSLWNAFMRAAQDGLLPDGREGAVVMYRTKQKDGSYDNVAQWMPMIFGILKKVRNSGQVAMVTARVVYEGDKYRYWVDDTGEHIEYEPGDEQNKDVVRRIFAMARTKDGELLVEPMSPADVEKIRNVSRAKDAGPWVQWWEEMAKKSALRRLAKRLPMSSDLDDLIRRDDALYNFEKQTRLDDESRKPSLTLNDKLDALAGNGNAKQVEGKAGKGETVDAETGEVTSEQADSADDQREDDEIAEEVTAEGEKAFNAAQTLEAIEAARKSVEPYLEDLPEEHRKRLGAAAAAARKRVADAKDAADKAAAEKAAADKAAAAKQKPAAAANTNAPKREEGPALSEELAAKARAKAQGGTKRLRLFIKSISEKDEKALAPIRQELEQLARQADEAGTK